MGLSTVDDDDDTPLAGDAASIIEKSKVGEVVEYEEVTETVDASTLDYKMESLNSMKTAGAGDPGTIKEEKKERVKETPF